MLKLQKPFDINKYVAVDPVRVNELHKAGFAPEYLYNNAMYFKQSTDLLEYLRTGIVKEKERIEPVKAKVEKTEAIKEDTDNTIPSYKKKRTDK